MTPEEALANLNNSQSAPNTQGSDASAALDKLLGMDKPSAAPSGVPPQQQSGPAPLPPLHTTTASSTSEGPTATGSIVGGLREGFWNDTALQSAYTALQSKTEYGDLFNPAKDLGIDQLTWDVMSPEERRITISELSRAETLAEGPATDDPNSWWHKGARIVGGAADPTSLIPIAGWGKVAHGVSILRSGGAVSVGAQMAGKGLLTMAGAGSAVGAADMALWSLANEGKVNEKTVAIGAGIGAVAPIAVMGVLKGAGKAVRSVNDVMNAKTNAKELVTALSEQTAIAQKAGMDRLDGMAEALKNMGVDAATAQKAVAKAQMPVRTFADAEDATKYINMSRMGTGKARDRGDGVWSTFKNKWMDLVSPADARLREIAPPVYNVMMRAEQKALQQYHQFTTAMQPHLSDIGTLKKMGLDKQFKKLALTGGDEMNTVIPFLRAHLGEKAVKNHATYRAADDELLRLTNEVRGLKKQVKRLDGHYPRWVKDPEQMRLTIATKFGKEYAEELDRIIAAKEKASKIALSTDQKGKIVADFVAALYRPGARKILASSRDRKIFEVDDDLVDAYQDIEQATHSHIRNVIEDHGRRGVLGKRIGDETGDDVGEGLHRWFGDLVEGGILKLEHVRELQDLLYSRYVNGVKGVGPIQRKFKAITHSSLLGQFTSSITQLEDISRAIYKHDLASTVKALFRKPGISIDPRKEGFVDHLAEEYVSSGAEKIWTDKILTAAQFKRLDLFSKRVYMDASISKNAARVQTTAGKIALQKKWFAVLGDEGYQRVVKDFDDFHKGRITTPTEDMKLVAFAELSETQPITLLGMPKGYLDHPHGRFMYLLRSFTIKQMDMWRTDVIQNYAKGNIKLATKNALVMTSLYTAAGMSKEAVVNMMKGKDVEAEEMFWRNLVRSTGVLDKYSMDRLFSGQATPSQFVGTVIAPPAGVISDAAGVGVKAIKDVTTDQEVDYKPEIFVRYVPLVGSLISSWMKDD